MSGGEILSGSRDKIDIEAKIKDILDKNKWWKQLWSVILGTFIIGFAMSLVLAWPVQWLWNETVNHMIAGVFRLESYWQTVYFLFLIRLIFPVRWK